jgi:hypothetical protein
MERWDVRTFSSSNCNGAPAAENDVNKPHFNGTGNQFLDDSLDHIPKLALTVISTNAKYVNICHEPELATICFQIMRFPILNPAASSLWHTNTDWDIVSQAENNILGKVSRYCLDFYGNAHDASFLSPKCKLFIIKIYLFYRRNRAFLSSKHIVSIVEIYLFISSKWRFLSSKPVFSIIAKHLFPSSERINSRVYRFDIEFCVWFCISIKNLMLSSWLCFSVFNFHCLFTFSSSVGAHENSTDFLGLSGCLRCFSEL